MDCAEEIKALRQTVGVLSGITDVTFNLLNGTMAVKAPEGAVDDRDIIAAVERAGMSVRPADNTKPGVSPSGSRHCRRSSPCPGRASPLWSPHQGWRIP
jgi:copper chaperone CopZ